MLGEEHLIPYHASDLTGRRVLCLAPHPDDETLGCGGALALYGRARDPVKVIFLTNGSAGDSKATMEKDAYIRLRRQEAEKACSILGVTDVAFWPYPDRGLAGSRGALPQMITLLNDYAPQLVYIPSPMEFHPDHRAACFLLCDAITSHDGDFDVAFYELGQPICVNRLVDITPVLEQKKDAISVYESQLKEQPYDELCFSLDRYRSMTLPGGITHAEGFSVYSSDMIKKAGVLALPFQRPKCRGPDFQEAGPLVSVIIRTQNRPKRLAHALQSVVEQTYANLEVVLVNDGGVDVADVADALRGEMPVTFVSHEKILGRSTAANSGLAAAKGKYINFLDDDDVLYPHHVETLVRHLETTGNNVAYTGVSNVYFKAPPDAPGSRDREEIVFNFDYDPDRLLFENYIPIMSVMFSRKAMAETKGFSKDLSLFEDWDFWIRMSRKFVFEHVDKVTAEYRFYSTAGMTESHRRKYDYDLARARLFERALPHMTGNAWSNYRRAAHERAVTPAETDALCGDHLKQDQTKNMHCPSDIASLRDELQKKEAEMRFIKSQNLDLIAQKGFLQSEISDLNKRLILAASSFPQLIIYKFQVLRRKGKRWMIEKRSKRAG
jgi:LmbE family N-acetylglucosaminyl deacetylase/glycosyltransferase involved in cell wall biosynthesis